METAFWLFILALATLSWAYTFYRVYTGEFAGRYTKRRWLLSVGTTWGLLAYWLKGEKERKPRQPV
jgi:hypothetical protein